METKPSHSGRHSTLKKDRYLNHLSKEENETLDLIADIIAGYVLSKGDELNSKRKRQEESNRYNSDSK